VIGLWSEEALRAPAMAPMIEAGRRSVAGDITPVRALQIGKVAVAYVPGTMTIGLDTGALVESPWALIHWPSSTGIVSCGTMEHAFVVADEMSLHSEADDFVQFMREIAHLKSWVISETTVRYRDWLAARRSQFVYRPFAGEA
jgi:hypothetical protein